MQKRNIIYIYIRVYTYIYKCKRISKRSFFGACPCYVVRVNCHGFPLFRFSFYNWTRCLRHYHASPLFSFSKYSKVFCSFFHLHYYLFFILFSFVHLPWSLGSRFSRPTWHPRTGPCAFLCVVFHINDEKQCC